MGSGRSRPREGHDRPRWRAKLRHRHDRASPAPADALDALETWIDERGIVARDLEHLERLDLTSYLRETAHLGLPATERLRKLAVALEPRLSVSDQPRGWLALDRIYVAGAALDPADAEIEVSRALSAQECGSWIDDRPEVARRMFDVARTAAARAIELRPSDARAHYALGMADYSRRHGSIEAALACFERGISVDPTFGWARLYRAHCLHDLGRWAEAARAYAEVDPGFLVGPRAWRYDLLREQRAWCLLQAGDAERALAEFLGVLCRYELEPGLARYQALKELTAAAEGPFHDALAERLARLERAIAGRDPTDASNEVIA